MAGRCGVMTRRRRPVGMKTRLAAIITALSIILLAVGWQDAEGAEAKSQLPDWRRYAALSKESGEAPIIALVIDDLGHSEREFKRVMALGEGITLAFLPYPERAPELAGRARRSAMAVLVDRDVSSPRLPSRPGGQFVSNVLVG